MNPRANFQTRNEKEAFDAPESKGLRRGHDTEKQTSSVIATLIATVDGLKVGEKIPRSTGEPTTGRDEL